MKAEETLHQASPFQEPSARPQKGAEEWLRPGERLDDLQLNGLRFIQDPAQFCFGMDAVLLSSFTRAAEGERVLDLCSGTGIIPVLLSAKTQATQITGLEIFPENVELGQRNIALNGLEDRLSLLQGDVRESRQLFSPASFEAVTCNPPYLEASGGRPGKEPRKAAARHELLCTLEDVAAAAAYVLKSSGRLYMVHRPFRLPEIIRTLSRHHLETKRLRLVYPFLDKEPNMVLLEAVKGGRSGARVEAPLVVYEEPGVYTEEILEIYGMDTA